MLVLQEDSDYRNIDPNGWFFLEDQWWAWFNVNLEVLERYEKNWICCSNGNEWTFYEEWCNMFGFENEEMIAAVNTIYAIAWRSLKKIQDFNGVWTHDLAIPVGCSINWAMKPLTLGAGQLWVHMFPWKKWVLMIYEINHIWTAEMKWKWRNDCFIISFPQFIHDLFHISLTCSVLLAVITRCNKTA